MAFGTSQINNPTPQWAKMTFRIIFLLLSFGTFMVSDYPGITDATKLLILKWFAGINMLTWGFSKLFGVEVDPNENNPQNSK
jgi:hypothetical protein